MKSEVISVESTQQFKNSPEQVAAFMAELEHAWRIDEPFIEVKRPLLESLFLASLQCVEGNNYQEEY